MCTLTFTDPRRPHGGATGYRAYFNRDEHRTRGPELPPASAVTPSGVRYLAPTDSDAGGTWIQVNEHGVTVALLNGYRDPMGPERPSYRSRGELVRSLADLESAHGSWGRLGPRELIPYRPAVIVVIAPGEAPLLARWDGRTVRTATDAVKELPVTSSSFSQDEVTRSRRALFHRLVSGNGDRAEAEQLERFQWWTDPADGATARTPLMSRPDAATRSLIVIDVAGTSARMDYEPQPLARAERRWQTIDLTLAGAGR